MNTDITAAPADAHADRPLTTPSVRPHPAVARNLNNQMLGKEAIRVVSRLDRNEVRQLLALSGKDATLRGVCEWRLRDPDDFAATAVEVTGAVFQARRLWWRIADAFATWRPPLGVARELGLTRGQIDNALANIQRQHSAFEVSTRLKRGARGGKEYRITQLRTRTTG